MTRGLFLAILWFCFPGGAFVLPVGDAPGCPVLSPAVKSRLVKYVHDKYKLPRSLDVRIEGIAHVDDSCHRKLRFQSTDGAHSFQRDLYLSPNMRYLSGALMDTTLDPIKEEAAAREALVSNLIRGDYPTLGPTNAPVPIVVFSDFQCPYCENFARVMKDEILPTTGTSARVIFRHFPLTFHSWARKAAETAVCARQQNPEFFWKLHDYYFGHGSEVTSENVQQKAAEFLRRSPGFDLSNFNSCLARGETRATVDRDVQFAKDNGIKGTPTVFVNGQMVANPGNAAEILTLVRQYAQREDKRKGRP